MLNTLEAIQKRLYKLKNKPFVNIFFYLIQRFEMKDSGQIYKKETVGESLKLSLMFFIANLFTFAFFVYAARKLGVVNYSELGVLLSIFFMFATATNLLNIIIIKYLSYFIAKSQYDKISRFCGIYMKITLYGGIIILVLLSSLSGVIAKALSLSQISVVFLGFLIFSFLVWNAIMGILNGVQYFTLLGLNKIFQAFFSTSCGLIALFIGFKAQGAILGMAIGTVLAIPLGIYSGRNIFFIQPQKIGKVSFLNYIIPAAFVVLCIGVISNIDLTLARHFLSSFESGNYAAVSLLGSTVFSFSIIASMVMFPKVAQLASNGEETGFLLKKALKYVLYMCLFANILFFSLSKIIVNIVFGPEFRISQYIGVYAFAMTLWAISNVLIMYNLALEKRFLLYLVPLAAIIEIILIILIHAKIWYILILLVAFQLAFLMILTRFSNSELAFLTKIGLKKDIK